MNANPNLDQLDLEILDALQREWRADRRREAWEAAQLQPRKPVRKAHRRWPRLLVGLACAIPLLLIVIRVITLSGV